MKKCWLSLLLLILCIVFKLAVAKETLLVYPQAGKNSIIKLIKGSQSAIDLVIYGFTDNKILSALIAAHKRGVDVRVMLDSMIFQKVTPQYPKKENVWVFKQLQKAGVLVKWSNPHFQITHQKTLIIDNKQALILTGNFTHTTFQSERNFGLLIDNPNQVKEILSVFNADWVREKIKVNQPGLVWSPVNSYRKLTGFIQQSRQSLSVYNQDATLKTINFKLEDAVRRGVKVKLLLPKKIFKIQCPQLRYLQKYGVNIRLDSQYYIHAKAMISDVNSQHPAVFIGSINFTEFSVFKNRELGIISKNPALARQLNSVFQQDWAQSEPLNRLCQTKVNPVPG